MTFRLRLPAAALLLLMAGDLVALPPDRAVSQYVRRAWTVEQGLPHGTVRGFAQTADGYLWLATYEGLVRFNGDGFHVLEKAVGPGIPNNSIITLCRTDDDTLWLGTFSGLLRYRHGRVETISTQTGQEVINTLAASRDGTVWVGTAAGRLFHVVGGRAEAVSLPLHSNPITALVSSRDATWIGTSGGLARYRAGKVDWLTTRDGLSNNSIVTLLQDGDDVLLAGTSSGLDRIEGNRIEHVAGLPLDQVTALSRDRDRNLWVGTYSHGLYRLAGQQIAPYGIAEGLLNPTVRAIFEDDEGSVWIGSNGGLEQLRAGAFVTWNKRDGLDDDFARVIFEDRDGVLWVGTANGLNRWEYGRWVKVDDSRLTSILSIAQSRDGTHWFGTTNGLYRVSKGKTTFISSAQGLSNNSIRAIHEDRRGDVWIATLFGLNRIHPDGRVESFAGRGGLGTDYTIAIAETPDGRVWVATGGGLAEFDGTAFKLHSAPRDMPSNRLLAIETDDDGTVWIATDGDGLVRYRNGRAKNITTREGLVNNKILSLVDDRRGNLWFGTVRGAYMVAKRDLNAVADGTLARVVPQSFDENDGLGSRQCNGAANPSAFRSRDGRIWFVTANGVSALTNSRPPALPPRSPVIERVSVNGKDEPEWALRSVPPGAERIEFDFSGVTFVTPERVRFRYRLEGYDNRWIDAGTNRVASYTNLPAGGDRFILASSRDGIQWRSTFLPFNLLPHFYQTKWFIALCVLAVVAALLALHSMRLHMASTRARLLERLVEDRTRQISEEKERTEVALRQTEAARGEAEAARREAERHERLTEDALAQAEEANHAKSIFLAATSHELRTPLNAIIGFSDILMEQTDKHLNPRHARFLENIHSSGQHLLAVINNILDLSKVEAGRMEIHPERIIVREEVIGICAVMKGVTTLRKIDIDMSIPRDLPIIEADPTLIKQILYNLMSNAVKFSPERSTVLVTACRLAASESTVGEDAIEIRVSDRGMGIDPKDHELIFQEFRQARGARGERPQGTGLGLALVKRFVELHRGKIRVESEPGHGSTFITVLPCAQAVTMNDESLRGDPVANI